ncbi:hypothetical protein ACVWYG_002921 [Pedobacter sp. UYEF25]
MLAKKCDSKSNNLSVEIDASLVIYASTDVDVTNVEVSSGTNSENCNLFVFSTVPIKQLTQVKWNCNMQEHGLYVNDDTALYN